MLPASIKLRHLNTFAEVARLSSVARAADALHVSQPAITKTIRELEQALGIALVAREGRGIRITHDGEVFLQHATAALTALRHGINSVSGERPEASPPVRIGALPTVSSRIMPPAIKRFLEDPRAGRVEISTGDNDRLLEQLRLGELDLVVGRLAAPDKMTGLTFEHLYSEKIAFVVRPGHALLVAKPFKPEALLAYPVLMPTRRSIIRQPVEQFLIARGLDTAKGRIDTVSDSFGRAFVKHTDAVWIISEGVIHADLAEGQLAKLPIDTSETKGPVGLTMVADITAPPNLLALVQAIRWAATRAR
jgi:LysR family transcriptional regulator, pca operon transcriptional activator